MGMVGEMGEVAQMGRVRVVGRGAGESRVVKKQAYVRGVDSDG